jgi:serine protease Do
MLRISIVIILLICSGCASAENSVQTLYKSVNSGVVELHVKAISQPQPGQVKYKATTADSLGSGALISESGRILTAAHVVDRATEIEVIYADGSKTTGHVVWVDSLIDLAMIQAGHVSSKATPLKLAKTGRYDIGEQVVVIGAPYGVSHSLSVGYLSGVRDREQIPGSSLVPRFLQTDAAINQGNSGGPMFNAEGEIIGIVSHILSRSGTNAGLGFVVSIDTIRTVMDSDPGTFSGFIPQMLNEKLSKALNNPFDYGMLIQQVIPGTLAHKLGFKGGHLNIMIGRTSMLLGGDILLDINGHQLKDLESAVKLKQYFADYKKGDKVEFRFLREGKEQTIEWIVE